MFPVEYFKGRIKIDDVIHLYNGVNSQIYLINNNYKIKIADDCKNEYLMLNELQNMTTVKIPKVLDFFKIKNSQDCLITEYISGVVMHSSEHYTSNLLSQISEYLKELHNYLPKNIRCVSTLSNKISYVNQLNKYNKQLSDIYDILYKLSDKYEYHYSCDTKVLTHGDLHGLNIICDENYSKVISVIDYGSSCYDDFISDIKLFGDKAPEMLKLLGLETNKKIAIGYFFHVIHRKLQELDYNINNDIIISHMKEISNILEGML